MYVQVIPNRNSPPAILLREGYREDGKVKNRTLANLSKWKPERIEALKRALKGDFDGVLGGVDPISDRIYGVLFVLDKIAQRIGIKKALGNSPMAKLALFLVLARVADQGSRLSAVRWARHHCVAEILGLAKVDEKDLYKALDWLAQHQNNIEKKLFRIYEEKNGVPSALVLYDVTSAYLEGDHNDLGAYGYCRDKKRGKKQIVIGLLTAADGEPLSVKVFKGNSSDTTTVNEQIETLTKRFGIDQVVFVGDRGMVKSKGKQALNKNGFNYITALTNPQVRKLLKKGIVQLDLFDTTVSEVQHGDVRLILRKNERVRWREQERRKDKLDRLTELVEERNEFVKNSRRANPEAGLNQLTVWSKKHKLWSFVNLELDGRVVILSVDEQAMERAGLLDGCYVMETDVRAEIMDSDTVDQRYRSLQKVERNFRTLKNGFLEIRPVYVQKEMKTRGHALVSMLALKIVNEAERLLKDAFGSDGKPQPDSLLEDALATLGRHTLNLYRTNNIEVLRIPDMNDSQIAICNALQIRPPQNRALKTC
jgi:transposase